MHSKDIAILPPFLSLPLYSVCSASLVLKILCSCQVVCKRTSVCTLSGAHGLYRLVMRVSRVQGSGSETRFKYTTLVSSQLFIIVAWHLNNIHTCQLT